MVQVVHVLLILHVVLSVPLVLMSQEYQKHQAIHGYPVCLCFQTLLSPLEIQCYLERLLHQLVQQIQVLQCLPTKDISKKYIQLLLLTLDPLWPVAPLGPFGPAGP